MAKNANVLVTGATGMVGSAIARALVAKGQHVRILRRPDSKLDLLSGVSDQVEHAIGDVRDRGSVEEALVGIERVYHCAARLGFGGRKERDVMLRINVGGTAAVVDAALDAGVKRLVHTSSIAALGRSEADDAVITEDVEWQVSRANSVYGESKRLAELEVHRGIAEGLDAVMVNPSLIFGIGRPGENTRQIIDKVRSRKLPAIPIGANSVVDVLDVANGHIKAMESGRTGERYILGSENLDWDEIVRTIAETFGVRPPRFHLRPAPGMALAVVSELLGTAFRFQPLITRETVNQSALKFRYSNRKAVEELGCTFRPFRDTVERIAAAIG